MLLSVPWHQQPKPVLLQQLAHLGMMSLSPFLAELRRKAVGQRAPNFSPSLSFWEVSQVEIQMLQRRLIFTS
ncbi:hypothetical protein Y1Q_0017617 [Alligator mississippiensis]|uniref:Uncharacterized protein n=1 Tax=Alligator mississippiensis TaxID=8496 RepID=A0A151P2R9_ALLMI|nr:hypothetical protein Y1Q_0017617 [Alligator mississippiensis]